MSAFTRFALPLLAVAGSVNAACSTSATATVQNGGDASAIATCTTFSGSVAIATSVAEDISFDGSLQKIDGNLFVESNNNIKRLSASGLTTVSGELRLTNVSQLAGLNLPVLNTVSKLTLVSLANLRALGFNNLSTFDDLRIENTQLQNLDGLAPMGKARTINIANNNAVVNVTLPLTNITSNFTIATNSEDSAVSLPNLQYAHNMVFRTIASLSFPQLTQIINGDLYVLNSKLDTVAAPNLSKIDGALVLAEDNNLSNVSFPQLTDVQANLQIANNTNLHSIQFDSLKNVLAAFDISGNITKVSTSSLDQVKGVFNLQSTGDFGDACSTFYTPLKNKGKISSGGYVCQGNLQKAGTAGTKPTATGTAKPSGAAPLSISQSTYFILAGVAALMLA